MACVSAGTRSSLRPTHSAGWPPTPTTSGTSCRRSKATSCSSATPTAAACLSTPSGVPGWRAIPSWYLVAADDATIPPEAERAMAKRAEAHTVEVASSHVAIISKPAETIELIVAATSGQTR
jgi:pimeloyl-ACP methyl ester carboxylesterase